MRVANCLPDIGEIFYLVDVTNLADIERDVAALTYLPGMSPPCGAAALVPVPVVPE